jgi:ribosomal protein L18
MEDQRLKLADDVTFQTLSDGRQTVILSLASGYLYTCNRTTAALLGALDGRRTLAQAIDHIESQFEVDRVRLAADMQAMARKLLDEGLLVKADGTET